MCLLLFPLLLCHCSNWYHVYNNNYNNNNSFMVLICLQPLCKPHLYLILHTTEMFKRATALFTRNFTQGWLKSTDCSPLCLTFFIYAHLQSAERSQRRRFIISPSTELYRESLCVGILILVYIACLLLLLYLESVRCICVLCSH